MAFRILSLLLVCSTTFFHEFYFGCGLWFFWFGTHSHQQSSKWKRNEKRLSLFISRFTHAMASIFFIFFSCVCLCVVPFHSLFLCVFFFIVIAVYVLGFLSSFLLIISFPSSDIFFSVHIFHFKCVVFFISLARVGLVIYGDYLLAVC